MFPFAPAALVIFHIPEFFAGNKRPLIHPDNQLTHPSSSSSSLLLYLQTYQQSSSLQSKSRKKNKGKESPDWFKAGRCVQSVFSCVSIETKKRGFFFNTYHSLSLHPKAKCPVKAVSACNNVFPPLLTSFQLADVTFFAFVTEAIISFRRTNEDQDAGNHPFSLFSPSAVCEKSSEKLRKSSAPSALLSAGGSAAFTTRA